jgi:ABC-type polysaccharide/polyol phosphate export permease
MRDWSRIDIFCRCDHVAAQPATEGARLATEAQPVTKNKIRRLQLFSLEPQYAGARDDLRRGLMEWPIWTRLGWRDVKRRYRRTMLGPFWATASLGMFIGGMVFIWAPLFKTSVTGYLPFLAAGMVAWTLIASLVNEGCTTYSNGGNVITQLNFPYSILNYILVWRNIIVFFHNVIIVVVVNFALSISVGANSLLLSILGLVIVALNGAWISVLLGIIGARYRDIPPLVANVMQVLMFITPVFWNLSQLPATSHGYLKLNYILHLIEVMRAPMLGQVPPLSSYAVTIGGAVIGWIVAFVFFAHFRRRIAYWL